MLRAFGVFLLGVAFSAVMISWSSFVDPDAFYHAKISQIVWEGGALRAFPWLDLTSFSTNFADHHYLFHLLEAPFVNAFGLHNGARILAIVLVGLFFAVAYSVLRWLSIRHPFAWTVLLALSSPLVFRLLLAKASPLALIWFLVGLAAAWKRKPWIVFAATALFALSHGGWIYLIGSIVLLGIGSVLYDGFVEGKRIHVSFLKEVVASIVGAGAGLMFHPNFPENLSFLWIQVVKIGLATPFEHVILGSEWQPAEPMWVFAALAPWLMLLSAGVYGVFAARHEQVDRGAMRASIAFALPVAVLLALTLKSRRSVEYLIPALFLWVPWLWNMVDTARLRERFQEAFAPRPRLFVSAALLLVAILLVGKNLQSSYTSLHDGRYPDRVYADAFGEISKRAFPGDRVFHSDWDEFPILWSLDDRLKYVAGLDPTFLYNANPELSNAYRDVTWGKTTTTKEDVWDLVHDRLNAKFIFIDPRDHKKLLDVVKSDDRYELLRETEDAVTFFVRTL
ncbi:MAG: hypothetical protein WC787_05205 [Patescibacteria group bacterium]|jgi:hypothetical protein